MREFPTPTQGLQASCQNCWKRAELCVCDKRPKISAPVRLLILQHPREAKNQLGSARLASLAIAGTTHCVGLSWRSLAHALGKPADPARWGVLYLGTQKDSTPISPGLAMEVRDRKGKPSPNAALDGIVLLDGNWKQSKTLWWRNPWLLKLQRVLLNPQTTSKYGPVRRQPRKRCLSTLEATAEVLRALGQQDSADQLVEYFDVFLDKCQADGGKAWKPASELPSEPA